MINSLITLILIYTGIIFIIIASVGIIKMPDVYTRMSATTKAVTFGVGFILLGVVFHFNSTAVLLKSAAIFIFLLFSIATASHVMGLAAYKDKTKMSDLTFLDEMKNDIAKKDAPEMVSDPDKEINDSGHTKGQ